MRFIPTFLRPHSRYADAIAPYVDGHLGESERARFEAHLAACPDCTGAVQGQRMAKALLAASLPEVEAPRSFRLTPAMVAGRPERQPRPAGAVLRVAQATTVVAALALGAFLVFDFSSSPDDETNSSAQADLDAAPEAASLEMADDAGGGEAGAGGGDAAELSETDRNAEPPASLEAPGAPYDTGAASAPEEASALTTTAAAAEDDDGENGWLRPIEFALFAVLVVSAGTLIFITVTARGKTG